jgi:long-chain fatty acid transport protein
MSSRAAVGLAVNAPFGLKTDWSAPWSGMFAGVRSEVKTLNINPVVGYRLGDHWLVGAGVGYQRLEATLSNGLTPLIPNAIGTLDGDDWSFGWNAGVLFESGHGTRVGVSYRSQIRYDIEGTLSINNSAFAALQSGVQAKLTLPRVLSAALSQDLGANTRLLADVTWTGWDSIQALNIVATDGTRVGQTVATTPLNFRNSWRAGAGVEHSLSRQWLVRAGLAYDRSPVQDVYRTPRLPDEDRKWLALGARFQPNDAWSFDVGYAHLWVRTASSSLTPVGAVPGALRGNYVSSSDVFGVQGSMRF